MNSIKNTVKVNIIFILLVFCICHETLGAGKDVCFKFWFEMDTSEYGRTIITPFLSSRMKLFCESCSNDTFEIDPFIEYARVVREQSLDFVMNHSNVNMCIEKLDSSGGWVYFCQKLASLHMGFYDNDRRVIAPHKKFVIDALVYFHDETHFPLGKYRLSIIYRHWCADYAFYVQHSTNMHYFTVK